MTEDWTDYLVELIESCKLDNYNAHILEYKRIRAYCSMTILKK